MDITNRLFIAFLAFLLLLSVPFCARAQTVTIIDGTRQNLVVVNSGASTSIGGWIFWRSKFIPEHVIFQFTPIGGPGAVNPVIRCTLDNNSTNPNDGTLWFQIGITAPNGGAGDLIDVGGPSVGGGVNPNLVETGVFPCVSWAIQPAGPAGSISGGVNTYKITAVQLAASGDASFLAQGAGFIISGAVRTAGQSICTGGGCPPPPQNPVVTIQTGNIATNNTNAIPVTLPGTPSFILPSIDIINDSSASATSTQTFGFFTIVGTRANRYGFIFRYTNITGAPAGCTLQESGSPNQVNFFNIGAPFTLTPVSATADSGARNFTEDYVRFVYNCGTFPTGGQVFLSVIAFQSS